MQSKTRSAACSVSLGMLLSTASLTSATQAQSMAPMNQQLSTQQKIALALSAGPDNIVKNATVVEPDGHGGEKIL